MDCSAEEQLVRMTLDSVEGVSGVEIDLDERTVTVRHDTDGAAVESALEALDLKMTRMSEVVETSDSKRPDEATERRVLIIALVINAALFVAEFVAGVVSRSMGLLADSLDMLADASVYALSLIAVGGSTLRKKRLAATSGYLQLGLAFFGLFEVARRFVVGGEAPNARTMIIVSLVALAGNIATMLILRRAKSPEAHFQASWIFTANDIKVNGLVIVSAVIVAITSNPTADLIAGAAIFLIVANGARRILKLAHA
jgi:Co/Zn/Cd efflux system component